MRGGAAWSFAVASTWRTRSRLRPKTRPMSSRVRGRPSVSPKRNRMMPASRSDKVSTTALSSSRIMPKAAASRAVTASESSTKSPSRESPSTPISWSREIGSRECRWISSTFSGVVSSSRARSSGVGSWPRFCRRSRCMRASLLILRGGEQRDLADLREVGPDRVGRGSRLGVPAGLAQCPGGREGRFQDGAHVRSFRISSEVRAAGSRRPSTMSRATWLGRRLRASA